MIIVAIMAIVAMKITANNQIVPGPTTPHFFVFPFPVALISSSEVTVMSLAPLQDTSNMDRNRKGNPLFRYQQLVLKIAPSPAFTTSVSLSLALTKRGGGHLGPHPSFPPQFPEVKQSPFQCCPLLSIPKATRLVLILVITCLCTRFLFFF